MIDVLARFIAAWPSAIRVGAEANASVHRLRELGLVHGTGTAETILCVECEEPHEARLRPHADQYSYFCRDLGRQTVAGQSVQLWRLVEASAADAIGGAFGVATPKWRSLSDNRSIWLGWFNVEVHKELCRVDLCVAVGSTSIERTQALRRSSGAPMKALAMLVLTTEDWSNASAFVDQGTALALMEDIVGLNTEGGFVVDWREVQRICSQVIPPPPKATRRGRRKKHDRKKFWEAAKSLAQDDVVPSVESATGPQMSQRFNLLNPNEDPIDQRTALRLRTEILAQRETKGLD